MKTRLRYWDATGTTPMSLAYVVIVPGAATLSFRGQYSNCTLIDLASFNLLTTIDSKNKRNR